MSKSTKNVLGSTWFNVVMGVMFGTSLGIALENWGVGIALGVAMALIFSTTRKKGKDE